MNGLPASAPVAAIVTRTTARARLAAVLVAVTATVASFVLPNAGVARAADTNPWDALELVRANLVAKSPLTARFKQTFLFAGFSEGETEEGVLAVSLPHCLRWNYEGDFPKCFLLCDDVAHYWNPGERLGHRYPVEDEESPGLDFFLLGSDELRLRYNASSTKKSDGLLEIVLLPISPTPDVTRVEILIEDTPSGGSGGAAGGSRIRSLSYSDEEGNVTLFELTPFEPGAKPGTFTPPAEMEWENQ